MTKVLYVRHGQTFSNVKKVLSDSQDNTPLTDLGKEQAKQAGQELKGMNIDRIICSPKDRAYDTAKIIAEQIGFDINDIRKDDRITEYNTGESAGLPIEGMTAERLVGGRGAEDPQKFASRVRETLKEISKYDGTTLIVGHGGTAKMIDCLTTGVDPAKFFSISKKPNAHAFELDLSWLDS
ncbi:MAG: histidine phosphatase family protein [Patescibacteria group bacterium]